jgi:polyhydroxyalkanoate synthesis regulator phasin
MKENSKRILKETVENLSHLHKAVGDINESLQDINPDHIHSTLGDCKNAIDRCGISIDEAASYADDAVQAAKDANEAAGDASERLNDIESTVRKCLDDLETMSDNLTARLRELETIKINLKNTIDVVNDIIDNDTDDFQSRLTAWLNKSLIEHNLVVSVFHKDEEEDMKEDAVPMSDSYNTQAEIITNPDGITNGMYPSENEEHRTL